MSANPSVTEALRRAAELVGGLAALGVAVGIPADTARGVVWAWADRGVVPPERCADIERVSAGKVKAEELSDKVRWVRVPDAAWPHPEGRPCIDVAREAA